MYSLLRQILRLCDNQAKLRDISVTAKSKIIKDKCGFTVGYLYVHAYKVLKIEKPKLKKHIEKP